MCDAILKLMAVHTLHPRVQLEGLSAVIELLTGAPEYLPRLLSPSPSSILSIFEEEKDRNPFASKSSQPVISGKEIAQQAADTVNDVVEFQFDTDTDILHSSHSQHYERKKNQFKLLILRHKKLGSDQENCCIS